MNIVIDAKDAVLGRLSSTTAKELLKGTEVHIVNAQDVIITGDPMKIKERYLHRHERGSPHHGPFTPKQPHMIVRRTIRGMLPYKTNKGRDALKKLRVYVGIPDEFKNHELKKIGTKHVKMKFIRVKELATVLGWRA